MAKFVLGKKDEEGLKKFLGEGLPKAMRIYWWDRDSDTVRQALTYDDYFKASAWNDDFDNNMRVALDEFDISDGRRMVVSSVFMGMELPAANLVRGPYWLEGVPRFFETEAYWTVMESTTMNHNDVIQERFVASKMCLDFHQFTVRHFKDGGNLRDYYRSIYHHSLEEKT